MLFSTWVSKSENLIAVKFHLVKFLYLCKKFQLEYFRPEGKLSDSIVALPVVQSKLRLYCLRLSNKILVLGNGGVKSTRRYEDDATLKGYVMTLQRFERLLKQGVDDGSVIISEKLIETDNIFEL